MSKLVDIDFTVAFDEIKKTVDEMIAAYIKHEPSVEKENMYGYGSWVDSPTEAAMDKALKANHVFTLVNGQPSSPTGIVKQLGPGHFSYTFRSIPVAHPAPVVGQRVKCPQHGFDFAAHGVIKDVDIAADRITIAWENSTPKTGLDGSVANYRRSIWLDQIFPDDSPSSTATTPSTPLFCTGRGCSERAPYDQGNLDGGKTFKCYSCRSSGR